MIFETDTPAGKGVDVILIISILASVTLATVDYGDISPRTGLGQTAASLVMILGYAIIAVPTGIATMHMSQAFGADISTQACPECSAKGHAADARHCKFCEAAL